MADHDERWRERLREIREERRSSEDSPFGLRTDPRIPDSLPHDRDVNAGQLVEPFFSTCDTDTADSEGACSCDTPEYETIDEELWPFRIQIVYCNNCLAMLEHDLSEVAE